VYEKASQSKTSEQEGMQSINKGFQGHFDLEGLLVFKMNFRLYVTYVSKGYKIINLLHKNILNMDVCTI